MTVILRKDHPNRMAASCHHPDFASNRSLWKTKPLDETPAPDCDVAKSLRVAVVDDSKDGADIMAMVIRLWGYQAEVAYGGAEALPMIQKYEPDVVLMDIAMPKVTGLTVARRLRRLLQFEHTLLIAITGYCDEIHRKLSLDAGFDYFLTKPCEPEDLKKALWLYHQVRFGNAGVMAVRKCVAIFLWD
jgi:CheY-like chemotaxis protein